MGQYNQPADPPTDGSAAAAATHPSAYLSLVPTAAALVDDGFGTAQIERRSEECMWALPAAMKMPSRYWNLGGNITRSLK